jgi:hypothetical protein
MTNNRVCFEPSLLLRVLGAPALAPVSLDEDLDSSDDDAATPLNAWQYLSQPVVAKAAIWRALTELQFDRNTQFRDAFLAAMKDNELVRFILCC